MQQINEPPPTAFSFGRIARRVAYAAGSPWATAIAFATVLVWAIFGPSTGYSENWQLTINTGTTIVTFLMVFLIRVPTQSTGAVRRRGILGNARGRSRDASAETQPHVSAETRASTAAPR